MHSLASSTFYFLAQCFLHAAHCILASFCLARPPPPFIIAYTNRQTDRQINNATIFRLHPFIFSSGSQKKTQEEIYVLQSNKNFHSSGRCFFFFWHFYDAARFQVRAGNNCNRKSFVWSLVVVEFGRTNETKRERESNEENN